jgi:hypothetical protein
VDAGAEADADAPPELGGVETAFLVLELQPTAKAAIARATAGTAKTRFIAIFFRWDHRDA